MDTTDRFSRFAADYHSRSVIQKEVAKRLVSVLPSLQNIQLIDIGCGAGAIWQALSLEQKEQLASFVAVDRSKQMLKLHPEDSKVIKVLADFNEQNFHKKIESAQKSIVISASALQWSKDLEATLFELTKLSPVVYVALFTANTFQALHQILGTLSPILDEPTIIKSFQAYYHCHIQKEYYRLYFENTLEMLRYIRRTGVTTGKKSVNISALRSLIQSYPLEYLEFEVLFIKGKRVG